MKMMRYLRAVLMVGLLVSASMSLLAQDAKQPLPPDKQTVESGKAEGIEFFKDLDKAMKLSAQDGRPVIAYFTYET